MSCADRIAGGGLCALRLMAVLAVATATLWLSGPAGSAQAVLPPDFHGSPLAGHTGRRDEVIPPQVPPRSFQAIPSPIEERGLPPPKPMRSRVFPPVESPVGSGAQFKEAPLSPPSR